MSISTDVMISTIKTLMKDVSSLAQPDIATHLSPVYTSAPNGWRTAHKWFASQMCICVGRPVNQCCAIRKRFAYHSPQTKICQIFAQTQRELDAPGVLCSPQVREKLINRSLLTRCTRMVQRVSGTLVYTKL